ncbi:hypothetical protein PIB30_020829 [Stylosanthes scabra]|uniref:Uncharacterized protein n=1 Tax=Stylosanthes scabra TaxID=79078 RepID=A0ABU6U7J7_9FABA|nr:hypothetical protein [Stylosanthes scabra]
MQVMSSCVGCLSAPNGYLGINPIMVLSCQMSWTQSKAAMSQPETCSIDVPQSDRTDTWSVLDQSISREVTGSGLKPFPRKEPGSITVVPYQPDQTESESTVTSKNRDLDDDHYDSKTLMLSSATLLPYGTVLTVLRKRA